MTDFYSVLLNSLKKREMWVQEERQQLYEQARTALIKKLWALRPGLGTAEIQERMELFEAAVDQLEADLEVAGRFRQFGSSRALQPPVYPSAEAWEEVEEEAEPSQSLPAVEPTEIVIRGPSAHLARTRPRVMNRHQPRQLGEDDDAYDVAGPAFDGAYYHWEEEDAPDWRTGEADEQYPPAEDEPEQIEGPSHDESGLPLGMGRLIQRFRDRLPGDRPEERAGSGANRLDLFRLRAYLDRSIRQLRNEDGPSAELSPERKSWFGRAAAGAVAVVSVAIVVWGVFYFLPVLRSNDVVTDRARDEATPGTALAAEAPPRPRQITTQPSSQPRPAPQPAPTKLADASVQERISLFDGRNPTVFTSAADNPIRFAGDGAGGFARIGSTATSPGARAVIGPGIAQRLAGKVVRVVIDVRSSSEQGATTFRFGYQAGSRVSPWKSGSLAKGFGTMDFTWQVPPAAGSANNFILIEPGVPGSGTGVDIRSITLDVLKPS